MHPLTNWTTGLAIAAAGIVVGCETQEDADERLVPVPEALQAPADARDPAPQRLNDNTLDVGDGDAFRSADPDANDAGDADGAARRPSGDRAQ